jgi:L-threonylcarbamoyladenylate synthase
VITNDLNKTKDALQSGPVAIPTETVYGLAANAFDADLVKQIFDLKKRPSYNPLIVHIGSIDHLSEIAKEIPETAMKLASTFWPGPLTVVLPKSEKVPDIVTAGKNTVAIRIPNHPIALQLLNEIDFPLAAPSANPFGSISPTTAEHVEQYFGNDLLVLDGGPCQKGIESTIIGFDGEQAIIYRLGSLSIEKIEAEIGKVQFLTKNDIAPVAPGMMSRHYAPKTDTIVTDDVLSELESYSAKKVGLLLFQNRDLHEKANCVEILSTSGNYDEASKNLYAAMHRLDQLGLDLIIAERLPDKELGKTINDKLERASKKE